MFSRYGFDTQAVNTQALVDAVRGGRNCIQATLGCDDDPKGQWGDSPGMRLWRAQLSSQLWTVFNRRETIQFSTLIPNDWLVVEPGAFHADGTQNEQCVLFGMHSDGPEPGELSLRVIGDRLVWIYHNKPVWQGVMVPEQWDDWALDVKWHNNPNSGAISIKRNGVELYGAQWSATLLRADQRNYLKIGPYLWGAWPAGVCFRRMFFQI